MHKLLYGSIEMVENGWVVYLRYPAPEKDDPFNYNNKQFIFAGFDDAEKKLREYFNE